MLIKLAIQFKFITMLLLCSWKTFLCCEIFYSSKHTGVQFVTNMHLCISSVFHSFSLFFMLFNDASRNLGCSGLRETPRVFRVCNLRCSGSLKTSRILKVCNLRCSGLLETPRVFRACNFGFSG